MPLPAIPAELSPDEIRDLVAKGWVPPLAALEPLHYLIRPFNVAKGYSGRTPLDDTDAKNIVALLAVFDHFGIPVPDAPEPEAQAA
jgi:hypothetical protein